MRNNYLVSSQIFLESVWNIFGHQVKEVNRVLFPLVFILRTILASLTLSYSISLSLSLSLSLSDVGIILGNSKMHI